jgi:hypothetical protein
MVDESVAALSDSQCGTDALESAAMVLASEQWEMAAEICARLDRLTPPPYQPPHGIIADLCDTLEEASRHVHLRDGGAFSAKVADLLRRAREGER